MMGRGLWGPVGRVWGWKKNLFIKLVYDQPKIVRKILRSLTKDFRPEVIVIIENKEYNDMIT